MTADTGRHWRRIAGSSLGLLLSATSLTAHAQCSERLTALQAAPVSQQSRWRELDASGRQLVRESGSLHGAELSLGLHCADWDLLARASLLDGTRLYDGQTSTDAPMASSTRVRQAQAALQANYRLADAWQWGGRLSHHTIWRDIASAGAAAGYPERYDWTILAVGAQWQTLAGSNRFSLAAWLGKPLRSSMQLNLPGRDEATLKLGPMHQAELAATWRTPLAGAWHLEADVQYHRTAMGQREDTVIQRSGAPVGLAHQPRTIVVELPVAVRIGYAF